MGLGLQKYAEFSLYFAFKEESPKKTFFDFFKPTHPLSLVGYSLENFDIQDDDNGHFEKNSGEGRHCYFISERKKSLSTQYM